MFCAVLCLFVSQCFLVCHCVCVSYFVTFYVMFYSFAYQCVHENGNLKIDCLHLFANNTVPCALHVNYCMFPLMNNKITMTRALFV